MNTFPIGWYLLYTRANKEKRITSLLTGQRITCFSPTTKTMRQWSDRKKLIEVPLFPSYVFIYLENMESFYKGLHTDGVLNYVRFGKQIAKVSEEMMSNIRILSNNAQDLEPSFNHFKKGQEVVITQGPLTGLSGEVIEYRDIRKILVRLILLQRNILVNVEESYLMSAVELMHC